MSGSLPAEGRWSQADTRHRSLQAKRLHCLISFQITLALLDIVQEIHNVMFGVFEYGCLATRGNTSLPNSLVLVYNCILFSYSSFCIPLVIV